MKSGSRGRRVATSLVAVAGLAAGLVAASALAEPTRSSERGTVDPTGQISPAEVMRQMQQGARSSPSRQEFPSFQDVSEGFEKVVSTADGRSFYNVWTRDRDGRVIAELPRGYERQRHFIALTIAGGDLFAGLQMGDMYVYWKRHDDRLALMSPNVQTRSTGDAESRASVKRIFTDRVVLDIPILAMGPNGQPVIDMTELLVGQAQRFFGNNARGINRRLAEIDTALAFPENIELAFKAPIANGQLRTFHYSISLIPDNTGYRPRKADERVGYFTTVYRDLGKLDEEDVWVRYINRWHIEKADPRLKMSPPKNPIVFYVDHEAPIRYRRWIRAGVEYWNEAFRNIGIDGAIEVRFQDRSTGAHMDRNPQDVRYNFIRWLSNDVGTAIGPSRKHPLTGEIINGNVVLTDGFIRAYWMYFNRLMPEVALEGFSPETMAWLDENPRWDPRLRLANPEDRRGILERREMERRRGVTAYGGHPAGGRAIEAIGDDRFSDVTKAGYSAISGMCMAAQGKAMQMAMMRMHLDVLMMLDQERSSGRTAGPSLEELPPEAMDRIEERVQEDPSLLDELPPELRAMIVARMNGEDTPEAEGEPEGEEPTPQPREEQGDVLDGIPEEFVGPLLAELVAHEVGHTLGLRHNFKGASVYSIHDINSEKFKGSKPWSTTVMDYNPVNIRMETGETQGDFAIIDIGPYDKWAIEFGYTFGSPDNVVKRVAEPELAYATDEDTWGPDPRARRWDMGKEPMEFSREQMRLAQWHRKRLIEKFVKEGDSWAKARRGYNLTLWQQTASLSRAANWIGGAFVYRDRKGDPEGRTPIEPVDAETQREALEFVLTNAFRDEAFGLTPDLLRHMTTDRWWDAGGMGQIFDDPAWPVHDRVMGVQSSVLTMLMNPTTLRRVYDNEFRVPREEDAITLAELLEEVTAEIWSEVADAPSSRYSAREPMISSLRRSLQREHLERLVDLATSDTQSNAAMQSISTLATHTLRELNERIDRVLSRGAASRVDPYSTAHLGEARQRIKQALEAQYIRNADRIGGGGMPFLLFGQDGPDAGSDYDRRDPRGW